MPLRKRVLDVVLALVLGVLTLPLLLVLAIGSVVSYRASPLFCQRRLGHDGQPFWFVKLRSLPASTPQAADKYVLRHVGNTRWGRFLRRYHLDELPQLWLVVAGKMSLVGPRPEMPWLSDTFDEDFVRERVSVVPGCTGLWQISDAAPYLIGEAPEFDLHYVRRWTLRLDLWVLARSLVDIVGSVPLRSLADVPAWTGAGPDQPVPAPDGWAGSVTVLPGADGVPAPSYALVESRQEAG